MPAPKQYPHEKTLALAEREWGLKLADFDSDIVDAVTEFNLSKSSLRAYSPALEKASLEIKQEMEEWLDEYEEEHEDNAPEPARREPEQTPPSEPEPAPQPTPSPAPSSAPLPVVKPASSTRLSPDAKREAVLEKLFLAGKTSNITLDELKKEGFEIGLFTLDSDGWKKGKRFMLKKERKAKNYDIIRL